MTCPSCRNQIMTKIKGSTTARTHIVALLLCIFGLISIDTYLIILPSNYRHKLSLTYNVNTVFFVIEKLTIIITFITDAGPVYLYHTVRHVVQMLIIIVRFVKHILELTFASSCYINLTLSFIIIIINMAFIKTSV